MNSPPLARQPSCETESRSRRPGVDARPVPSDAVSMISDDLDPGERAAIAFAEQRLVSA
jgi:hypothetical protein